MTLVCILATAVVCVANPALSVWALVMEGAVFVALALALAALSTVAAATRRALTR